MWRIVVIESNAKLSYKLGYLIVRNTEEKRVHLDEISTLIVESNQCVITTNLINECAIRNINLIFCDAKHLPSVNCIGINGNTSASKRLMNQINWSKNKKELLWQIIIKQKIFNQASILAKYNKNEAYEKLILYVDEVLMNDSTNREGFSAKVYFNALFGAGFDRRNEEIEPNGTLNYVYSMLLSLFSRYISGYGYSNQLGIWHKNEYNFYNLACDLMEPFRMIVDDFVLTYKYKIEQKHHLHLFLKTEVKINGKNETIENSIKTFIRICLNYLESNEHVTIPVIENYEFKD